MRLDKDSLETAILILLLGQVSIFAPIGAKITIALARHFLKKWWEEGGPYVRPETDPEQVRDSIYKLKRNEYIRWKIDKKTDKAVLEVTEKGRKAFGQASFSDITIPKPQKWDGKWRFFLFDVPEKQRIMRDTLRSRLKSLGFFQFQKSVWIHPFECEKELRLICEYLTATPYATMFTASIDNDRTLRRYFLREGVLLRHHVSLLDKGARY